ncbi:MAG: AAA family ATPase, partial [bacterium]
ALANQKGGCGKTTTAVNLAAGLTLKNQKVLLIDMDSQANTTSVFFNPNELEKTMEDVLINKTALKDVIIPTKIKNLDLAPSDIMLSAVDIRLANVLGRENILKRRLKNLNNYDYIIIDTPPSLGLLTINSLTASEGVIIPISMSYFALKGIKLLEETIEEIKKNLDHPHLKIIGVLATCYDPITNVSKDALRFIQDYFKDLCFKTIIRKNIRLEEAHSAGKSIFEYDPKSSGAEDYNNFIEEVLKL